MDQKAKVSDRSEIAVQGPFAKLGGYSIMQRRFWLRFFVLGLVPSIAVLVLVKASRSRDHRGERVGFHFG